MFFSLLRYKVVEKNSQGSYFFGVSAFRVKVEAVLPGAKSGSKKHSLEIGVD